MTLVRWQYRKHHVPMPQSEMPTMRSRRLGGELRQLRLAADKKVQDAAEALECGQPKISQIETGRRGIRPLDLTILLNLYGVEDDRQRSALKRLAKEIHKVGWWSGDAPMLRDSLRDYLTLEADSDVVRAYEPSVLPGQLQTEAYMRQIFSGNMTAEASQPMIDARLRRQKLLEDELGFRFRTIIDVAVLHRIAGGSEIAREQLDHLLTVGKRPNVHIQILPLDAALPMDQYPPFNILGLRGDLPTDVIWLEHITGGTLLEQRSDIQTYAKAWDELTAAALSPSASQRYIRDLIKESGS